jgi:serine/threonine-protein kinase
VKVTDFGIARAGTSQMTEAGSIVGTAQYLSPEQARGGEVDPRSDLYSLGIVLYELLTGQTPFDGETPVEIAMKHLSTPPKAPSKLRPDIPRELDLVVMRALAKNPDDRYQSADQMEADLERVARGARVSAATVDSATQVMSRPAAAAVAATSATAATMIAAPPAAAQDAPPPVVEEEEEYREGGGKPIWPWLVAIGFIVAALVAGFFVWHELSGAKQVPVNNYVNEPVANAQQQITQAGLHADVQHGVSARFRRGIVFKQDPAAGTKVDKGGTVTIWVSTGPPKVNVPDVKGEQWTVAQQALVNAGLQPQKFSVPGNTAGKVTATDPAAGQSVPKGSTVRVNVMSGPVTAAVPSVVGLSVQEATSRLNAAGFKANPQYVPSTATKDQVISQTPTPGTSEPKGSSVTIKVSIGPPLVTVPDVVGYTSQQAVQALEAAGFQVNQQYTATDASQQNIVQSQSPAGGQSAAKNSPVTIVIGQHSPGPPPTTTTTTTP